MVSVSLKECDKMEGGREGGREGGGKREWENREGKGK